MSAHRTVSPQYTKQFVIVFIMIIIHHGHADVVNKRFTGLRRKALRLRIEYVEEQFTSPSKLSCTEVCMRTTGCRTMSWCRQSNTCLLSSTDATTGSTANLALQGNASCNTWSWMEYTVFSLAIGRGERVSFEEAVNRCQQQSTEIAGAADLLYSRSLGFEYYRCCWLADGSIGYVMQHTESVIYCTPYHNPWVVCLLN